MKRLSLYLVALGLVGCMSPGSKGAPPAASEAAPRCELPAPADVEPGEGESMLGGPLAPCSPGLKTGWFRDGTCRTDASDRGVHVVCA